MISRVLFLCLGALLIMSTTDSANAKEQLVLQLSTGGPVVIDLKPDIAPKHVERITTLTKDGFYDGVKFHRVIDGFMAQTGDPTGTGMGGSDLPDLEAEFNDTHHGRGAVSMARTNDPDSANSQFFICFKDCGFLNKQYTVWGQVVEGMDYVDSLERGEPPLEPSTVVSAKVVEAGAETAPVEDKPEAAE